MTSWLQLVGKQRNPGPDNSYTCGQLMWMWAGNRWAANVLVGSKSWTYLWAGWRADNTYVIVVNKESLDHQLCISEHFIVNTLAATEQVLCALAAAHFSGLLHPFFFGGHSRWAMPPDTGLSTDFRIFQC